MHMILAEFKPSAASAIRQSPGERKRIAQGFQKTKMYANPVCRSFPPPAHGRPGTLH
jgi:hypothetical protein